MAKELEVVSRDELKAYVNSACQYFKITPSEMAMAEVEKFGILCNTMNLSPLKREVYAIPFKDYATKTNKFQIVVGYEVYIKRAVRSGKLQGYSVKTSGSLTQCKVTKGVGQYAKQVDGWKGDLTATITIHIKDWSHPFEWEVNWGEYTLNNSMWLNKPHTMLKKVAMAQGFRLAFPDEIDGLPYTSDEMPDKGEAINPDNIEVGKPAPKKKVTPKKATPIKEEIKPEPEIQSTRK